MNLQLKLHLGLGQPDFKTPKHVVEAAKKALDDGHHGYVLSNGILECRQAVSRKIKTLYNQDVDPERIIIMPGGKPTMHYAIQCFGEPGVEIIHPTPAFPIYESMINYTGSTPVPYDLTKDKDLKFNAEEILSLITDKTRLLILINPNNPTGSFVEKSEIDKLAKGLEQHPHVTILSDEIYSRQIFDSLIQTIGRAARNVESKVLMYADNITTSMKEAIEETDRRRTKQLEYNKINKITPISIKKNIQEIIENTAEQDHVTVEIDNAKELVGKDLNKHIKNLEKKMNEFASKLEFEDAARLRDEINRLKAKEVGLSNKVLQFKKN